MLEFDPLRVADQRLQWREGRGSGQDGSPEVHLALITDTDHEAGYK